MTGKKIWLTVLLFLLVTGVVAGTIAHSRSDVPAVTTAKAVREDLVSTVNGTGEIKPKVQVNVGTTAFGRITHLYVKEGDHVKAGQLLATVESQQQASSVAAQNATIAAAQTNVDSYIANEKTAQANVLEAQADLEQKRFDYQRASALYQDNLIAKQDFDAKKAAYDVDVATLAQRQAEVRQAKAQVDSARSQVKQDIAMLQGDNYSLELTRSIAPFDGLVTNVPVREGETVVEGIQNSEGSTLMTLADMSIITAEVKVDETDIPNVALGQTALVSVDAFPGQTFTGKVTEVGDQALLRTTGLATSQSTTGTEEAKDFKVVVTLDPTKVDLRPGLTCTAKITTAHKPNVLAIPIQALVLRDPTLEKVYFHRLGKAPSSASTNTGGESNLVQGVYQLTNQDGRLRVRFVPVTTGIAGSTDIEALSGLKPGDEVVTGHYRVLRMLHSGTAVKRDNSVAAPVASDDSST